LSENCTADGNNRQSADNISGTQVLDNNDAFPYADIINLPHHVSKKRPQMSMYDRAAQFAPFAALTGHDARIKETEQSSLKRLEEKESGEPYIEDC
jgi:hypothetical protein